MGLEPWMGSRQTSRTRKSPHKKDTSAQRAQNSATRATARRTTLHRSEEGRSTSISLRHIVPFCVVLKKHTRLFVHTSACLKHSNFLNTDRMRKRDSPTAVHMKPFSNNSDSDVKQLPSNSNLKTGTRAPNLVEHLCLLGSTYSCPINQD